jgi:hypothetical protein
MPNYGDMTGQQFSRYVSRLRRKRRKLVARNKEHALKRSTLAPLQRGRVLAKSGGLCHICGGEIVDRWHADHVMAHSAGGRHAEDNYLPAHPQCNVLRWHYTAEEFQIIVKLGVMARSLIERGGDLGLWLAETFLSKERSRSRTDRP